MRSALLRLFARDRALFVGAVVVGAAAAGLGTPPLFVLFGLTLAGVALFHHHTLPVALTQDWGIAQDLAAASAIAALAAPRLRLRIPVPGAASLAFLAFLAYALLTPEWARRWEGHPGNEPKTLRMAVAIGHFLTLDVEGVSAAMEELPVRPLPESMTRAAAALDEIHVAPRHALVAELTPRPFPSGARQARPQRGVARQTEDGGGEGTGVAGGREESFLSVPTERLGAARQPRRHRNDTSRHGLQDHHRCSFEA